jgi:hypothetical protein
LKFVELLEQEHGRAGRDALQREHGKTIADAKGDISAASKSANSPAAFRT